MGLGWRYGNISCAEIWIIYNFLQVKLLNVFKSTQANFHIFYAYWLLKNQEKDWTLNEFAWKLKLICIHSSFLKTSEKLSTLETFQDHLLWKWELLCLHSFCATIKKTKTVVKQLYGYQWVILDAECDEKDLYLFLLPTKD